MPGSSALTNVKYNEKISKEQADIFNRDQEDCILVTREEYDKRGRALRIKESLIRLISPIL